MELNGRIAPPPTLVFVGVSALFLTILAIEALPIWLLTQQIAQVALAR